MVSESTAPPFLASALDGCEWSASRSSRFTLGEGASGTHCIGGWVDPRAGLDSVEWRNSLVRAGNRTLAVQPVARRCTN
jgi:hypothetical protein